MLCSGHAIKVQMSWYIGDVIKLMTSWWWCNTWCMYCVKVVYYLLNFNIVLDVDMKTPVLLSFSLKLLHANYIVAMVLLCTLVTIVTKYILIRLCESVIYIFDQSQTIVFITTFFRVWRMYVFKVHCTHEDYKIISFKLISFTRMWWVYDSQYNY